MGSSIPPGQAACPYHLQGCHQDCYGEVDLHVIHMPGALYMLMAPFLRSFYDFFQWLVDDKVHGGRDGQKTMTFTVLLLLARNVFQNN